MILTYNKMPIYFFGWLALIIYATWSHLHFGNHEASIALGGWSAHDFTNTILHPENFIRDYPGGSWTSGNSSLPWLYPALASIGIPVSVSIPIFIALEIMVLTFGAFYLLQTLFRNIHPVSLFALTCAFALSYIRFSDLARFASPFFHGHFYGYADGLRLIAIAFYLRGRHRLSSTTLIIGFTIHPIKTLFGFMFICGMQLWKWRTTFTFKIATPYLVFAMFAGLWAYFWLGLGHDIGYPQMSAAEFFKYSPLFHSHWYPQDLNILTNNHLIYSTAFLSSLLVGLSSMMRCNFEPDLKMQLLLGILLVCLMTIIGLTISWNEISPTLVRICLQRSSVLILSIMTILTLGRWLVDIRNGQWWYALLLGSLIISAFYNKETWFVLISLVYTISTLLSENQKDSVTLTLKVIIFSFSIFIISYEYYLYIQGLQNKSYWLIQIQLLGALTASTIGYKLLKPEWRRYIDIYLIKYSPAIIIILFTASATIWSIDNKRLTNDYIDKGNSYKAVQLWARDNTNTDDLFMTDPTISYGWRDFSQRSSFGTLQEWFKTGWLYTNNQESLHEGLERAARLGINELVPERYEKKEQWDFISKAYRRALNTFYKQDGMILASIAKDYDIQYIVMEKSNANNSGAIPPWQIAFDNKYYIAIIPPHIHPAK